jgi:hypothetical protein
MTSLIVGSTSLLAVGYAPDRCDLEVHFRDGTVYQFFDVPPVLVQDLLSSTSKGAYFNTKIRNHFRYQCISQTPLHCFD